MIKRNFVLVLCISLFTCSVSFASGDGEKRDSDKHVRQRTRMSGGVAGCVKKTQASCCTKDEGGPFGANSVGGGFKQP